MALACKLILNYRDVQRDIGHKWFRTPFLEMGCLQWSHHYKLQMKEECSELELWNQALIDRFLENIISMFESQNLTK